VCVYYCRICSSKSENYKCICKLENNFPPMTFFGRTLRGGKGVNMTRIIDSVHVKRFPIIIDSVHVKSFPVKSHPPNSCVFVFRQNFREGASKDTIFRICRTQYACLVVCFLCVFLDRSNRAARGISERKTNPSKIDIYFKFPTTASVF
jgi:hypothetical protein